MPVSRHRHGRQFIVQAYVASATTIAAGDAVYLDGDDNSVKPASDFPWNTDLATTQAGFVDRFLGMAQADHPIHSGNVNDFPVDISPEAVYELDTTETNLMPGQTLGLAQAAGNALRTTRVAAAAASSSCFRALHQRANLDGRVLVRMQSAFWGVNDASRQ